MSMYIYMSNEVRVVFIQSGEKYYASVAIVELYPKFIVGKIQVSFQVFSVQYYVILEK